MIAPIEIELEPITVISEGRTVTAKIGSYYEKVEFQEFKDYDSDGLVGDCDVCPYVFSTPDETDTDGDGVGDSCDNCPNDANPAQGDTDNDGIGNACDNETQYEILSDFIVILFGDIYRVNDGVATQMFQLYNMPTVNFNDDEISYYDNGIYLRESSKQPCLATGPVKISSTLDRYQRRNQNLFFNGSNRTFSIYGLKSSVIITIDDFDIYDCGVIGNVYTLNNVYFGSVF